MQFPAWNFSHIRHSPLLSVPIVDAFDDWLLSERSPLLCLSPLSFPLCGELLISYRVDLCGEPRLSSLVPFDRCDEL